LFLLIDGPEGSRFGLSMDLKAVVLAYRWT